jgi:serine/threonine-protein kinase
MAPELALGRAFDGRSDLYSLGAVAYFLLSGRLVFEGSGMEMLVKRLEQAPPSIAERTELPVPADLDRLILACLARTPEERPASAAALARALGGLEVSPWTDEQARDWWAANRPEPTAAVSPPPPTGGAAAVATTGATRLS